MELKEKVIEEIKKIYDPEIPASARASVGVYNTKEDFDKLNESINKCKKIFNL